MPIWQWNTTDGHRPGRTFAGTGAAWHNGSRYAQRSETGQILRQLSSHAAAARHAQLGTEVSLQRRLKRAVALAHQAVPPGSRYRDILWLAKVGDAGQPLEQRRLCAEPPSHAACP
jgi:hypothetical protein